MFRKTCLLLCVLQPVWLSGEDTALAPVNGQTRFVLADGLPHLASSLSGSGADAVILRQGEFQQQADTILTQVPQAQGKQQAWLQMSNYWVEPVTPPPGRGDPLIVPIDDMRVAEVQGEVTLSEALTKPGKVHPLPVNEDMEVPDGATLSTAANGSAAILVGGHTSIRLVPNSQAIFHYTTSIGTPRLEVDIQQGALFCKIGKLANGHVADVAVRGPVGEAASIGSSDFFAKADPVSFHVCLVVGKLMLGDGIPLAVGNMDWFPPDMEATATSGVQVRHWPGPTSDATRSLLDAQVLNFALHQTQSLNLKIRELLDPQAEPLSADDQAYLAQIPRVTWYARAEAQIP